MKGFGRAAPPPTPSPVKCSSAGTSRNRSPTSGPWRSTPPASSPTSSAAPAASSAWSSTSRGRSRLRPRRGERAGEEGRGGERHDRSASATPTSDPHRRAPQPLPVIPAKAGIHVLSRGNAEGWRREGKLGAGHVGVPIESSSRSIHEAEITRRCFQGHLHAQSHEQVAIAFRADTVH